MSFSTTRQGNLMGISWMLLWAGIFNTTMSLSKTLSPETSVFMILFVRTLFSLSLFTPMIIKQGNNAFKSKRKSLLLVRSLLAISAMLCTYYAYRHLPLSLATSVGFSGPLIVSALAILFLGEHVNLKKGLTILLGYVGVLIMINPQANGFDPDIFVALLANFLAAGANILGKMLSTTEDTTKIMVYFQVVAFLISGVIALFHWQMIPLHDVGILCLMGATATASQYCYLKALKHGEATIVTPFEYTRLIFAIPVGIYFFEEVLQAHTFIGAAVIIASALALSRIALKQERAVS